MPSSIVRPRNETDTAVNTAVTVNANSFTTIVAPNEDRLYVRIQNTNTNAGVWVCLCSANSAMPETSMLLVAGSDPWESPPDNMYIGEISAKTERGEAKLVIMEY